MATAPHKKRNLHLTTIILDDVNKASIKKLKWLWFIFNRFLLFMVRSLSCLSIIEEENLLFIYLSWLVRSTSYLGWTWFAPNFSMTCLSTWTLLSGLAGSFAATPQRTSRSVLHFAPSCEWILPFPLRVQRIAALHDIYWVCRYCWYVMNSCNNKKKELCVKNTNTPLGKSMKGFSCLWAGFI